MYQINLKDCIATPGSFVSDKSQRLYSDNKEFLNKWDKENEKVDELMKLGIKLFEEYINSPLPPFIQVFSTLTLNFAADAVKNSKWNIRHSLVKKHPDLKKKYELLEFLTTWIWFCHKPNYDKQKKLFEFVEGGFAKGNLTEIICQLLEKFACSTFIILLDEVSALTDGMIRPLLDKFRENGSSINIILICTCLPETHKLIAEDTQLRDRFLRIGDVFHLSQPMVSDNLDLDTADDFSSAMKAIVNLARKNDTPYNKEVPKEEEKKVRLELIQKKEKKELTWSTIWEKACYLVIPNQ